jgi:Fe-S oxidoreductase
VKKLPSDSLSERADVLYWVGCNTALRSGIRKTAIATVNVLNEANVKIKTLGEKEGCCGVPMIFGGLFKDAGQNAERVVRAIDEASVETLVTSCSGCYETFVNFYPNKLDIELPCEVLHTSQLLERLIKEEKIVPHRLKMRVSYHDPCGLGRHCGVYDAPRNVLQAIPDLQLVEPFMKREHSRCCGGGGGFWGVNSEASMSLARLRILEDIAPLNADALATTCPLCYTNFLYTSTKHSLGMNICDIVEILDMALRKND